MRSLRRFLACEGGSTTIEFVLVVPVITTIFFASFESSFFMIRHVMLERAVDIVVRGIRLGAYDTLTHRQLKERICERGVLAGSPAECRDTLRIWMQPINTATFAMVAPPRSCVDRSAPIDPDFDPGGAEFAFGSDNEIMLLRICMKQEPLFASTIIGAGLTRDEADGNYALVVTSVFVNEPG